MCDGCSGSGGAPRNHPGLLELTFGLEPVLELTTWRCAPLEVDLVRASGDLLPGGRGDVPQFWHGPRWTAVLTLPRLSLDFIFSSFIRPVRSCTRSVMPGPPEAH